MSDEPTRPARPLIGFTTGGHAPQIVPAPTNRGWMSATRQGWANRCLPLLITDQSGWERRKYEFFLGSRQELAQAQASTDAGAGERVPWQGHYTRGSHADGEAGSDDHRTRRDLRPFASPNPPQ